MKKLTLALCLLSSRAFLAGCGAGAGIYSGPYTPAAAGVGVGPIGVGFGAGYGYPSYYWSSGYQRAYYPGYRYYWGNKYYGKKAVRHGQVVYRSTGGKVKYVRSGAYRHGTYYRIYR